MKERKIKEVGKGGYAKIDKQNQLSRLGRRAREAK
jgi:hypothetical protein